MNLQRVRLWILLIISIILLIFFPHYLPHWTPFFLAPFLITCYYQKTLVYSLWVAFFCGLVIDLLSSHTKFGIHALIYCTTTFFLYPQKRHFFADHFSTLPIMTYFFSLIAHFSYVVLGVVFGLFKGVNFSFIFPEIFYTSLIDPIYACFFLLPFLVFGKRQRKGEEYFT